MNVTTVGSPRNNDRKKFLIHVSDVLPVSGPRAFCARHQILSYWSNRLNAGGKLTPGRRLLFARGEFEGQEIVYRFLRTSVYGGGVYAKWSCRNWRGPSEDHETFLGCYDDAKERKCKCGLKMRKHNEIDLVLPHLRLTGHPDMVIFHNGRYYVYEFKSIDRADVNFDDLAAPLADHKLQVSFYYKMMVGMKYRMSRRLTVMYVDRSNAKIWGGLPYKELQVTPEADEFLNPYRNKLLHVVHGIKTKVLPPRICPNIKSERAKACPFAVECFEMRGSKVA